VADIPAQDVQAPPVAVAEPLGHLLKLTAATEPKPAQVAPATIKAAAGADVTFTASSDVEFDAPILRVGEGDADKLDVKFTTAPPALKARSWVAVHKFAAQPENDVYASATIDGKITPSEPIKMKIDGAASDSEGDKLVETQVGEYDKAFAKASGAVLAGFAVAFALAVAWAIGWAMPFGLGILKVLTEKPYFGTWGERTATVAQVMVMGLGAIVVLAGVWMAAMEVRGRQRSILVPITGTGLDNRDASTEVIGAFSKLAKDLKGARGTIATLVIGAILVLVPPVASAVGDAVAEVSDTGATSQDSGQDTGQ
jgi:hypothetical protein